MSAGVAHAGSGRCVRQPGRLCRRRRICCRRVCGQGGGEGRLTGGKKLDNDVELLVSASGMCAAKTGFSTLACRGRRVLPAGSTASGTRNCLCASAATLGPPSYFDDATGTPAKNRGVGRAAAPDQPAHAGRGGGYRTACQQADPAYRSGRHVRCPSYRMAPSRQIASYRTTAPRQSARSRPRSESGRRRREQSGKERRSRNLRKTRGHTPWQTLQLACTADAAHWRMNC